MRKLVTIYSIIIETLRIQMVKILIIVYFITYAKKNKREKQVKEQEERITREEPLPKNP